MLTENTVLPSSAAYATPAIGALNATATPAEVPTEAKSLASRGSTTATALSAAARARRAAAPGAAVWGPRRGGGWGAAFWGALKRRSAQLRAHALPLQPVR
jgi:hypothetical protein